jgi:dTDP-4-amino-4,6-dideoxygalactose transaminase
VDLGIPNAIYYPVPLHRQKAYQDDRYQEEDFEVTNALSETVISLPMHTELEKEQQDLIIKSVIEAVEKT